MAGKKKRKGSRRKLYGAAAASHRRKAARGKRHGGGRGKHRGTSKRRKLYGAAATAHARKARRHGRKGGGKRRGSKRRGGGGGGGAYSTVYAEMIKRGRSPAIARKIALRAARISAGHAARRAPGTFLHEVERRAKKQAEVRSKMGGFGAMFGAAGHAAKAGVRPWEWQ